ncbi:MAG TPA: hypothetical protein VII09_04030 [Opitutaceae bacterium]
MAINIDPGFPRSLRAAARLAAAAVTLYFLPGIARADNGQITAVSSQVSADYSRTKLPDGSFQAESYTFGEGGHQSGAAHDDTIDKLTFLDVAKVIAVPLAKKNYVPVGNRDPDKTQLLIMVYWGTTTGTSAASESVAYQNLQNNQSSIGPPPPPPPTGGAPSGSNNSAIVQSARRDGADSAMATVNTANWERDQSDMRNARLLGYDEALSETGGGGPNALSLRRDDLINEIEDSRYFIVLMAYDYQALWKHKKHKLLWVTRFSIRERGADFSKVFPSMAAYASQFFGQDSHGLLRQPLPEGNVEIGEVKSLGTVPEK